MTDDAPLIEMVALEKHFPITPSLGDQIMRRPPRAIHAVDGVSLTVQAGETLGLIGESGSGKTTLGWMLVRLHEPTAGSIRFDGKEVSHLKGAALRLWRRNVQIVFQDPVGSLDPRLRVWQIIGEPIQAHRQVERWFARNEQKLALQEYQEGIERERERLQRAWREGLEARKKLPTAEQQRLEREHLAALQHPLPPPAVPPRRPVPPRLSRAEIRAKVREALPKVGLPVDCLDQYPHEFSGGGRQRISLARALAVDPRLIILDEPTSALDVAVQAQILNRLVELQRQRGIAYVLITHNVAAVRFVADRVAVMYLGRIVEHGPVREVLERPVHPYTKALLAAVPVPDVSRRRTRYRIGGDIPSLVHLPPGCRFAARCPFVIDRCRAEDPPLLPMAGTHRLVACHRAEEVRDIAPETLLSTAPSSPREEPAAPLPTAPVAG